MRRGFAVVGVGRGWHTIEGRDGKDGVDEVERRRRLRGGGLISGDGASISRN